MVSSPTSASRVRYDRIGYVGESSTCSSESSLAAVRSGCRPSTSSYDYLSWNCLGLFLHWRCLGGRGQAGRQACLGFDRDRESSSRDRESLHRRVRYCVTVLRCSSLLSSYSCLPTGNSTSPARIEGYRIVSRWDQRRRGRAERVRVDLGPRGQ